MTLTWEDEVTQLKEIVKKEFKEWQLLSAIDVEITNKTLIFANKNDNYRIYIQFSNLIEKQITVNIQKKDERKSWLYGYTSIKFEKITIGEQKNNILHCLRTFKKEIELKELFKK